MDTEEWKTKTAWCLSFLLGQASALLGLAVAVGWLFAFALIVAPKGVLGNAHPSMTLPIEPPLIGLLLGALGLWIAQGSRQPVARYSVVGVTLNAIPLALAVVVLALRVVR